MGTSGYQCTRCTKKTKTKSAVLPTSLMSFFSVSFHCDLVVCFCIVICCLFMMLFSFGFVCLLFLLVFIVNCCLVLLFVFHCDLVVCLFMLLFFAGGRLGAGCC